MTDKALWAFSDTSGNCSNTISLCEATKEDAPFIAAIYNQAILAGNCTCDTKTVTSEMREKWICQHAADGYPVYLCLENGIPVGYGTVYSIISCHWIFPFFEICRQRRAGERHFFKV